MPQADVRLDAVVKTACPCTSTLPSWLLTLLSTDTLGRCGTCALPQAWARRPLAAGQNKSEKGKKSGTSWGPAAQAYYIKVQASNEQFRSLASMNLTLALNRRCGHCWTAGGHLPYPSHRMSHPLPPYVIDVQEGCRKPDLTCTLHCTVRSDDLPEY